MGGSRCLTFGDHLQPDLDPDPDPDQLIRREDFRPGDPPWQEHPDDTFARPTTWAPGQFWIYQVLVPSTSNTAPHQSGLSCQAPSVLPQKPWLTAVLKHRNHGWECASTNRD